MDILIADDDEALRVYLELVLRALSHGSAAAGNGVEALELLENFAFDAIVLDVEMPVMGGIETLQHIRRNPALRDIPVYALTSHSAGPEFKRVQEAGFSGYLLKPCSPEALRRLLSGERAPASVPVKRECRVLEAEVFQEYQILLRDAGMSTRMAVERTLAAVHTWLAGEPACVPGSQEAAHSLAGSCAVIGAFALRTAMKDLEHLARTEAADGWPDALRRASGLLRETHAAFGAALNGVLPDERL